MPRLYEVDSVDRGVVIVRVDLVLVVDSPGGLDVRGNLLVDVAVLVLGEELNEDADVPRAEVVQVPGVPIF